MKNKSEAGNVTQNNSKTSPSNSKPNYLNNYKIQILIELIKHLSLIMLFWNFICTFNYEEMKNRYGEEIFTKPNSKQYLKPELVQKFNDYIRLCREESTSDYKKYPLLKNPKISAIMPIYNGGKYLYYSLRSIQNQEMKDIEIILVDDCSTDNSLSIIANYMKEDKRIRLIKNQYNRKILYSKSIAALNANGKFIIELDQDDMFIRNDVFDMLFYEAENNNLDLVHIRDFIKRDFTFKKVTNVNLPFIHLVFPREMHYKQQPELTQRNFVDNNNYLLWGLLIKSDLYKKAIYKLWPIIMNYQMIFHEDYTISFMIVILSKRYKYLNNFALVHLSHSKAASEKYLENDNYYLGIFFFASTLYNYYLKYHENEIYILLNYVNLFMVEFKKGKSKFHDLFKYIIKLILNSRFLGDNEKNDLIKRLDLNKYYYKTNKIYEYLMTQPEFDRLCLFQNKQINRIEGFKISVQNPILSIIIFCSEYTHLKKTINSIENQFLEKNEIILVLDQVKVFDEENLEKIDKLTKKFWNIKLIKNNNCNGTLCSIYNGVINARGNYTLILQPGMNLYRNDTLYDLYEQARDLDYPDIFQFGHLINNDGFVHDNSLRLYKLKPNKNIKSSLSKIQINEDYKGIDTNKDILSNKFIKTEKLKTIMEEIYNFFSYKEKPIYNYYEDIILFALKKAKSKKAITKTFGTIQYINKIRRLNITAIMNDEKQKMEDSISYINYLFQHTDDEGKEKMKVLHEFYNMLGDIFNRFNDIPMLAFKIKERFMKCESIPQIEKKNLEFYINSLLN